MPLIDQHKVVTFKGFHGNSLLTHLLTELIYVDDFDGALEHTTAVLIKQAAKPKARQV